jgi:tetratricopeptide (TPR) repeat protein
VGPGHFAYEYRAYRPLEDALASGVSENADAAHSVPLQMLAEGGLLWGVPYLLFLVAVTIVAWRAVTSASGRERLLAAAVASAWIGYVVQSLISIDMIALAVLGWVLAGAVAALAPVPERVVEIALPWRRRTKRAATPAGARVAQGVAVLLALVVVWGATIPFRADLAASDPEGLETAAAGQDLRDRSTELAGWEPEYWLRLVAPLTEQGHFDAAQEVANTAVGVAPHDLEAVMTSARLEDALENPERARELYEQALAIEPVQVDVAMEAAQFAVDSGDPDWARTLLEQVLSHRPDHEAAQALLDELGATVSG